MSISIVVLRRAFRRSRLRGSVLVALERLGEASLADLARATGAESRNLRGALLGDEGAYRPAESLQGLGLVSARASDGVVVYSLTRAGVRVLARLRREEARAPARLVLP